MSDCRLPLDTGVLIALAAATGGWEVLDSLGHLFGITPVVLDELRNGTNLCGVPFFRFMADKSAYYIYP